MKTSTDEIIRPRSRSGNYADQRYRDRALRVLVSITQAKPDKGKKWISQAEHDLALYGGMLE